MTTHKVTGTIDGVLVNDVQWMIDQLPNYDATRRIKIDVVADDSSDGYYLLSVDIPGDE